MKTRITLIILCCTSLALGQNKKTSVNFYKNVELLGYIIEIIDPAENDPSHPISKIIHQFPEDKQQKSLKELLQIASNIDYSTLIHLMYFLPEFPLDNNYQVHPLTAKKMGYNTDQEKKELNRLVALTNEFYLDSNFTKVWNQLTLKRQEIQDGIAENRPGRKLFKTMERFYGKKFFRYQFIPSLTLWSAGFGVKDSNKNRANFVFGPLQKNFEFGSKQEFRNLTIHEFGHSFVNPVVLNNSVKIQDTEKLYSPLKKSMTKQGYSNWTTCLIEHFVRASEIIINEELGDHDAAKTLLKNYAENRNFKYLSFIVQQLKTYRNQHRYAYEVAVSRTIGDLKHFVSK